MAGAFTHFTICNQAKRKRGTLGLPLYQLLNKYSPFLSLGAASPDLPYLSFVTGKINWADVMHYEKTNSIVISGHKTLKTTWLQGSEADKIKFVWLMGYVSHLVADATIHPIVNAIVGPYEEHKTEHRLCEMIQDALIFNQYNNNDITYAEFSSVLKFCNNSASFDALMDFWKSQVIKNFSDKNEEPHSGLWFTTYTNAIDAAEGGSDIVAIFRHAGIGTSLLYQPKETILSKHVDLNTNYFEAVKLPSGRVGSFKKEGFEKAVNNVIDAWNKLYVGLATDTYVADTIKNWNLDTGVDQDSIAKDVTYWA
jgi:hypothetical protein